MLLFRAVIPLWYEYNQEVFCQATSFRPRVRIHNKVGKPSNMLVDLIEDGGNDFEVSRTFSDLSEQELVNIRNYFDVLNDIKLLLLGQFQLADHWSQAL